VSPASSRTAQMDQYVVAMPHFQVLCLHVLQVKGEAQGDQSSLDKFIQHLNQGPSAAEVNKVDTKEISVKEGESDFTQ